MFLIHIDSQLQRSWNEGAATLPVVLGDNTTFGGNIPSVPQFSVPPSAAIVQGCTIVAASILASLFSTLLTTRGESVQHIPISTPGSTTRLGQSPQQKHISIISQRFRRLMELTLLPMLVALSQLGWGLLEYFWGIETTPTSIPLRAATFGIAFYLFSTPAAAANMDPPLPHRVPESRILHWVAFTISPAFRRAFNYS